MPGHYECGRDALATGDYFLEAQRAHEWLAHSAEVDFFAPKASASPEPLSGSGRGFLRSLAPLL